MAKGTVIIAGKQRRFAVDVVRKLRDAGFTAYWAGGCVRDQLLGRAPVDYDVATDATPPEIRRVFGPRRTLPIGAAFGVITVLGPPAAGQIDVATFRCDDTYSDGRRPDSVRFTTAEEDACRRDFTINGLFFDPLADEVIDFVGGSRDLEHRLVRAIGHPEDRFAEDKLRLLRAVRFAATLDFGLEEETYAALCRMAPEITTVSPERIGMEIHRMLVDRHRVRGVELLVQTGLADAVLPEIVVSEPAERAQRDENLTVLAHLADPGFPLAMAALLDGLVGAADAGAVGQRLRLSNEETERIGWLLGHRSSLAAAPSRPWSAVQRVLVAAGAEDLLAWLEAAAQAGLEDPQIVSWGRSILARPREQIDPPPLLTGHDLIRHGLRPGPQYGFLLDRIRDAQLDGEIRTSEEALSLVDRLLEEAGRQPG